MLFAPQSREQREKMLELVGVSSIDELFSFIPKKARLDRPLDLDGGCSEMDLVREIRSLAHDNDPASERVSFAGAGCYDHFVPAIVDAVIRKPGFYTAYTPYQPEVSQGTLQAIYEFQSMICGITGMDVANASMYDGATALVEAALLAVRVTKRDRVLVSAGVHPEWRETLATYAAVGSMDVVTIPAPDGITDPVALCEQLDDHVAAVLVSDPNVFGCLEDVRKISESAAAVGALFVAAIDPILTGVLEPPEADVIVGEGQSLGGAMSLGGPGLGFFACRECFLRKMPGRIVGRTKDVEGRRGFVLTMQTREQHIRREKATSNICSNHALNALAATVYLSALGDTGLREMGERCVANAHHLHDALVATGMFETAHPSCSFGREFVLHFSGDVDAMRTRAWENGFVAGIDLASLGIGPVGSVLFTTTERHTQADMDAFVSEVTR